MNINSNKKVYRFILVVTRDFFFPYENCQEVEQMSIVAVQFLSLEVSRCNWTEP